MFCSWDMGHLEAQCMSGANHGSIQFLPLVLRFLCEISSSFNQPRYSDRTQAIQVVLFPIQKQGKTMRLSEFANWTTGPWTFNRSPHGLNGHVLLISYIYIYMNLVKLYWTQPTSPANCWVCSQGVTSKMPGKFRIQAQVYRWTTSRQPAMAYKDSEKRPVASLPRPLSGELRLSAVLSSYVGDEKRLVRLRQCLESVVHQTQILGWSKGKDWRFKWTAVRVSTSIYFKNHH